MEEPAIMDVAKHNYLIKPLANTFTFGIYGLVTPVKAQSGGEASAEINVPETSTS